MTNEEYENMLENAHSIPIEAVGSLVVTNFQMYKGKPTGECCKHSDNKRGNFRFYNAKGKNFAKCFTCGESFTTINLVKAYKGYKFKETINFLYDNFPTYFDKKPYSGTYSKVKEDWNGLSNEEYMFLKIPTRLASGKERISIREFSKKYPYEHDIMIVDKIIKYISDIEKTYEVFLKIETENLSKIKKDRLEIYKKLSNLLKKGMVNQTLLDTSNGKLDLEELLKVLKTKQEREH